MEFIQWGIDHGLTLIEIAGALVGVASLITGLTKTPKDDKVVAKIKSFLSKLSVLTHKDEDGTFKILGK